MPDSNEQPSMIGGQAAAAPPSASAQVRRAVASALYADALMNPSMVKSCLVALLREPRTAPDARKSVSEALALVCPGAPGVAEGLARIVLNPLEAVSVRLTAAKVLETFCGGPTGVGTFLRAILADRKAQARTRRAAAFALRASAGMNTESVRALARVLLDRTEDGELRNEAAGSLGKLGREAGGEIASLGEVLGDRDDSSAVRENAAVAMVRIANSADSASAAPPTESNAVADAPGVWASQVAVGEPEDGSAPLLAIMLDRNDPVDLRVAVAGAVGRMDRPNAGVSRVLTGLLQDRTEEPALRIAAISSLGKIQVRTGADHDLTLERLMPVMSSWDEIPEVNAAAFRVLGTMGL